MRQDMVTVLRRQTTRRGTPVPLPARPSAAAAKPGSGPTPAAPGAVPQQVRVIESNQEYAILEVLCSCGATMHIQCNYGNVTETAANGK
jgi:hypothetical protein